jgi:hypothetical protein
MSRIPHCLDNRLTDGGEVVSLTTRPHSTSQKPFLVLISVRLSKSQGLVRPEGLGKMGKKNSMTSSETGNMERTRRDTVKICSPIHFVLIVVLCARLSEMKLFQSLDLWNWELPLDTYSSQHSSTIMYRPNNYIPTAIVQSL